MVSLRERVVGEVNSPSLRGISALRVEARAIAYSLPKTMEMTHTALADRYGGRKKRRYINAAESLKQNPLHMERDSLVNAFVKSEKFHPDLKVDPAPRMIQARNTRFNLEIGIYLRPIEHHIYRLHDKSGLDCIGKGKNLLQRAQLLERKMSRFNKPLVYSLDCSRFDQHVSLEQLKIEQMVYLKSNPSPYFSMLLDQQLFNKGFTQHGIRYKTRGKRMSGDMQTALGNCLLMIIMTRAACAEMDVTDYELLDDGDDCLLICEVEEEYKLGGLLPAFHEYGHELKLENRATALEDVIWCKTKPVWTPSGYRFVADWIKTLSSSACGTRYWGDPFAVFNMAFSVGQCLLALYGGIPIIQAFALRLCSVGERLNEDIFQSDIYYKVRAENTNIGSLVAVDVHPLTRESFARAWGVGVEEQLAIESRLAKWQITTNIREVPYELAPDWVWEYQPGTEPAPL